MNTKIFHEKGDDLGFSEMLDIAEKEWEEQKILRDFNRLQRKMENGPDRIIEVNGMRYRIGAKLNGKAYSIRAKAIL